MCLDAARRQQLGNPCKLLGTEGERVSSLSAEQTEAAMMHDARNE